MREAIGRELQKLARELVASLQFYQSQPGSLAISEILVSGGTSRIPGLAGGARAADARRRPARRPARPRACGRRRAGARRPRLADNRDWTGGGGLMRAVNLLPEEERPGNRWAAVGRGASARRVLGGSGIAAGVLALAFAGLFMHQRASSTTGGRRCTTSRPGSSPRRRRPPRCRRRRRRARHASRRFGRSSPSGSPGRTSCATSRASCPRTSSCRASTRPRRRSPPLAPRRGGRDARRRVPDRLHGHRLRRLAGSGRAGPRPARAAPVARRRDAPVERPRQREANTPVKFTIAATLSPTGGR